MPRTLITAVACAATVLLQAQAPPREAVLKAAREVIAAARYATLTTIDELGGFPYSRVVDPFAPENDFAVWVGTNAESRKVEHIARNPRVTLLYFDPPRQHYVSLVGSATVVRDAKEKSRRFKPEWQAFYRNGSAGDDYVLIRIDPSQLEIVAESLGMKNDPATWRPVTIRLP
jgi:general stress protein 26